MFGESYDHQLQHQGVDGRNQLLVDSALFCTNNIHHVYVIEFFRDNNDGTQTLLNTFDAPDDVPTYFEVADGIAVTMHVHGGLQMELHELTTHSQNFPD